MADQLRLSIQEKIKRRSYEYEQSHSQTIEIGRLSLAQKGREQENNPKKGVANWSTSFSGHFNPRPILPRYATAFGTARRWGARRRPPWKHHLFQRKGREQRNLRHERGWQRPVPCYLRSGVGR